MHDLYLNHLLDPITPSTASDAVMLRGNHISPITFLPSLTLDSDFGLKLHVAQLKAPSQPPHL